MADREKNKGTEKYKKLNTVRMKKAFQTKQKVFFIIY